MSKPPRPKFVAVICFDTDDFIAWKKASGHQPHLTGTRRKYQVDDTIYICVHKVIDLCSFAVDEIATTVHAHKNPEYEEIMRVAQTNLIPPKITTQHESPRPKDAFLESIRMYDRLSNLCQLYRDLSKQQDIVINLLKKSRKSTSQLIEYSNACDRIGEIKKQIEDAKI
jgi:hypothetical protein